jgi:argininosuccinate lyase
MNGILVAMLTCLKGTHSGYNRDLHEDKVTLVNGLNLAHDTIEVLGRVLNTVIVNKDRMNELVDGNFAAATELANYLVRDHDVPFRQCHRIVGYVVSELVRAKASFRDLKLTQKLMADKEIQMSEQDLLKVLGTKDVVERQTSEGGCAPQEVKRMMGLLYAEVTTNRNWLEETTQRLREAKATTFAIAADLAKGHGFDQALARLG